MTNFKNITSLCMVALLVFFESCAERKISIAKEDRDWLMKVQLNHLIRKQIFLLLKSLIATYISASLIQLYKTGSLG